MDWNLWMLHWLTVLVLFIIVGIYKLNNLFLVDHLFMHFSYLISITSINLICQNTFILVIDHTVGTTKLNSWFWSIFIWQIFINCIIILMMWLWWCLYGCFGGWIGIIEMAAIKVECIGHLAWIFFGFSIDNHWAKTNYIYI